MWSCNGFILLLIIFGCQVSSTNGAGLFGSILGDGDTNGNRATSPNIPLISSLGFGSNNRDESNRPNENNNEYSNNDNSSRGLLPLLGVPNINRPIVNQNNNNRLTNANNVNKNVNDLKKQMTAAEKLLERLKELNRIKEQQKLEIEKNNQKIVNPGDKDKPSEPSKNKINDIKDGRVLKSLTKKKFFHIVEPVVPEGEATNYNQTVYYYD